MRVSVMNSSREKISTLGRMLAIACVAGLAAAALSGCSSAKPHPVALRVSAKPKPALPRQQHDAEEEDDDDADDSAVYGGPETQRLNLPLAGTSWEWQASIGLEPLAGPAEDAHYRLEFKPNGWFDVRADCRHAAGIYEASGQRIVLAIIKASRSACHKASPARDFLNALEAAKTFRVADGKLYVDLKRDFGGKSPVSQAGIAKTLVFTSKP